MGVASYLEDTILVCSLCNTEIGPDWDERGQMYFGRDKVICPACVKAVMNNYKAMVSSGCAPDIYGKSATCKVDIKSLKPRDIKALLDEDVVGQEKAKRILSIAAYNHYKRIMVPDEGIEKSNILLVGPTGSGKTYLVKTLAKILDVPLAIADATSLTESGYVGDDVESILTKLLHEAGGSAEKAERGIIFIDEIDKLSASNSAHRREVGAKGVQQALLKLLEGTVCEVPVSTKKAEGIVGQEPTVRMDTSNILFICGGAFPDAEEIISERLGSKSSGIGFGSSLEKREDVGNLLLNVKVDDLRKFGMIPEFLGRLPVIAPLEDVTIEMLKRILVEPKNSITKQYISLMGVDGVLLTFDSDALDLIAERAIEQKTGARALRSILEEVLEETMFIVPSERDAKTVNISRAYIEGREALPIKYANDFKITYRL